MKKIGLCALILTFMLWGTTAFAVSYSFLDIPSEDSIDLAENFSLTAEIVDDTLKFTVTYGNEGPDDSFIGGIYWDFGSIEDLLEIPAGGAFVAGESSPGIDFSDKNKPKAQNLSQSNNLPDPFNTNYSATAQNGNTGIDPGGSATFSFDIVAGADFNEIIAALESGDVQTGIHVQGIEGYDDDSDSYIASVNPVPEPATMLLLGAGLIGAAGLGRKKLFKRN